GRTRSRERGPRTRACASGVRGTPRAAPTPSPGARAHRSRREDAAARRPSVAPVCSQGCPRFREYNHWRFLGVVVHPNVRPTEMAPPAQATFAPGQTNGPRSLARRVRPPVRAGVCSLPRLLPDPLAVRAVVFSDRLGRRARGRDVHTRLLPPRARPLHRAHDHEAVAGDTQEPEGAYAPRALPGDQRTAPVSQGLPAASRQGRLQRARGAAPPPGGRRRDPHLSGGARDATARPGPQDLAGLSRAVLGP